MSAPEENARAGPGSRTALVVLVALAIVTPWALGGVDARAVKAITLVALGTAFVALAWDFRRGLPLGVSLALWPAAALWMLAILQLVPLPISVHQLIAPGSASVWHPETDAAALILGPGPWPISLHPEATRRSLAFATGLLALALAATPALRERRLQLRASVAIVAGGLAVALYGLAARLVFVDKLYGVWSVPTIAPFGPFVSKNHFAGYVELTALLAVGLASGLASEARRGSGALGWIESRRARWVVAAWGAVAILVLAVPVSLSRGGVVALACGLVAFASLRLWLRREPSGAGRRWFVALAGMALGFAALAFVLPESARDRVYTLAGITSDASGRYRLVVWRDTLRLVGSSPWVGSGFGAYQDALPRLKTAAADLSVEHAENDYLELMAEGGLAAFVLMVGFVAPVLGAGWRGAADDTRPLAAGLTTGAVAGLVAIAVHSAFDFNLRIPSNALLCAVLLALVLRVRTAATGKAAPRVAVLTLAITFTVAVVTPWAASRVDSASLLRAAAHPEPSLRRSGLEAALTSHVGQRPADAAAWLALAWLRLHVSHEDASRLAQWAVSLDPTNEAVRNAHSRLDQGAGP